MTLPEGLPLEGRRFHGRMPAHCAGRASVASSGRARPGLVIREDADSDPCRDPSVSISATDDRSIAPESIVVTRGNVPSISVVRFMLSLRPVGVSSMHRSAIMKLRPGLERLEAKQLLSAVTQANHVARLETHQAALARRSAETLASPRTASDNATKVSAGPVSPDRRQPRHLVPKTFIGYRITNPTKITVNLIPPFGQVLVQSKQPVPGQVYNVMSIAVKNGTAQTFTASNNFVVRFPNRPGATKFPVLTGNQQWLRVTGSFSTY